MQKLHPKIQERKAQATPINYRSVAISAAGELIDTTKFLDERVLAGYAVIWGKRNSYGEKVLKGAYTRSIEERGPKSGANYKIKMMGLNHDYNSPLSFFSVLEERTLGLYFETEKLPEDEDAEKVLRKVRSQLVNNYSVGFNYVWDKTEWDDTDNSIVIKEAELFEISPVSIPADMETFTIRSAESDAILLDDINYFIKQLPRRYQLEARQLFTLQQRNLTAQAGPQQETSAPQGEGNKFSKGLDFDYLLQNFKL